MGVAEIFKKKLGGNEGKSGIGDLSEFRAAGADACVGQSESDSTDGECAEECNVMDAGDHAQGHQGQDRLYEQGCQTAGAEGSGDEAEGLPETGFAGEGPNGDIADE